MAAKTAPGPRPVATFDHLKKRQRPADSLFFIDDDVLKSKYEQAKNAASVAELGTPAQLAAAKKTLKDVEAEVRDSPDAVELRFRGVSSGRFQRLMRLPECRPTQAQLDEAEANGSGRPMYNAAEFHPRLVAACLVEPELTVEQVKELFGTSDDTDDEDEGWGTADVQQVVGIAIDLSTDRTSAVNLPN